jgi:hypothetical protein
MKQNESSIDRIIRIIVGIAAILIGLFYTSGVLSIVLYVVAAILLVTAILGVCPLYMLFHFSTKKQ